MSICPSVYLSICLPIYLSVCLSICLSIFLYVHLSIYMSIYLPICLSICLYIYLSVCISICLYICLPVCLSVGLTVCLSILCTFGSLSPHARALLLLQGLRTCDHGGDLGAFLLTQVAQVGLGGLQGRVLRRGRIRVPPGGRAPRVHGHVLRERGGVTGHLTSLVSHLQTLIYRVVNDDGGGDGGGDGDI